MDKKKIYNLGIQTFIQFNPKSAVYTILMNNEIKMTDKANMSHYIIYFYLKEEFSFTNGPALPTGKLNGDYVTIKKIIKILSILI